MRAVVTGAEGFIGSHLAEALLAQGHSVTCVDQPAMRRKWLKDPRVEYAGIGVGSLASLKRAFEGADLVFHLAGITAARRSADFYRVNTLGTENVLKAAAVRGSSAPRVILVSSLAAVGPCRNGRPLDGRTAPFPISHYGQSKLLAESLVHAHADVVPSTIVRLPAVYGPRERNILSFFQLIARGVAVTIGSWKRELSMIHVHDAVAGLLAASGLQPSASRILTLAHPEPVSWRTFAEIAGRALGREPVLISVPAAVAAPAAMLSERLARFCRRRVTLSLEKVREIAQDRWVCEPQASLNELGLSPQFDVARGIPDTISWYREAQWL